MSIVLNQQRLQEIEYKSEKEFEEDIWKNSKTFFGPKTVYINAKKKIEAKTLGQSVPDGFFFDLTDLSDPQFYIVEAELASHDFYSHIFPQVTKFFAFYKNQKMRKVLIDKLYGVVQQDTATVDEFRKRLGGRELYKFISDAVENSRNILLLIDGTKDELPEIMETYSDTWGKMVRVMEIRKYGSGRAVAFSVTPDLENIQLIDETGRLAEGESESSYTEEYHLDGVKPNIEETYKKIKRLCTKLSPQLKFNPKKYYVSIRSKSNLVFIIIGKKKIRFVAMMPEKEIHRLVHHYTITHLSKPVQNFYNGPCAAIEVENSSHLNEIRNVLRELLASER